MELGALIAPEVRAWAQASLRRFPAGELPAPAPGRASRRRGMLVVHLDGVPRSLLQEAVELGQMPFLSRLVRSGAYHLDHAFWGSPASTPAFQAGLLYGLRHPNLPAYWWFDREAGRRMRMNAPKDALAIDHRLAQSGAESLLCDGGTSYLSLFRAGADNRLCMSSLAEPRELLRAIPETFRGVRWVRRRGALAYLRAVLGDLRETTRDVLAWGRQVGDWRHEKEYLLNRFFLVSLGWNLAHTRALIDLARGAPAVYLVYGNYDEVAHRRGPFSAQARAELFRVDHDLQELFAMAGAVERPYDVYLLTDHGHVDSTPFEQRTGARLEEYLLRGEPQEPSADLRRGLLDGREPVAPGAPGRAGEPVVVESGNFAHVYLGQGREPLEARELLASHPGVLARAAGSPEIGIAAVRRGGGAVALVGGGVYGPGELDRAPLAPQFSRRALADLLWELPHMKTAGDLVLFGEAVLPTGTVGFAWEFGSHGGLTNTETDSVILWPAHAPLDLGALGHAAQLYQRLSSLHRS